MPHDRSVVLDDDPTGTQAVHDLRVLLRWSPERVAAALADGAPAVHVMTNVRALSPERAREVTADAAAAARAGAPGARIVLRGDSTLRGHLLEEYLAVDPDAKSVLLLVPALPAAGRTTRGGVHRVDGTPAHETEYARDGAFAYSSSRLLEWAQERTGGLLASERGTEVALEALRERGGAAVAEALAAATPPAACAPDAETISDLERIAAGLREAEAGTRVIVRCAPAFAGVLSGRLATTLIEPPPARRVLIVCGSYVASTTRQLEALRERRGVEAIELDPLALAGDGAQEAIAAAAAAASAQLDARGLALVATARERPAETANLEAGLRIARNLARVVPAVHPPPDVVVAKGGITSHVTFQEGLGAHEALVAGPLLPGVALWRTGEQGFVVVPGNVGGPDLLVELVDRLGVGA